MIGAETKYLYRSKLPKDCKINFKSTFKNEKVIANECDNNIVIKTPSSRAFGGAGNDLLKGRRYDDRLRGGPGADELRGNSGNDILRGGTGADLLIGHKGNDLLIGRQGNDVIRGSAGDDTIKGDQGTDIIRGGRGADLIHFSGGKDQILDFKPQQGDRLILKNKFSFAATELNGDLILNGIKNNAQITICNIDLNTMLAVQPELFS